LLIKKFDEEEEMAASMSKHQKEIRAQMMLKFNALRDK
jgi:hypothetical protein